MSHKLNHVLILLRFLLRNSVTSDLIIGNVIQGKGVDVNYLDCRKAFDKAPHQWLLRNLILMKRKYLGMDQGLPV